MKLQLVLTNQESQNST